MSKRNTGTQYRPSESRDFGREAAISELAVSDSPSEADEQTEQSASTEAIGLVVGQGCPDTQEFGRLVRERRLNRKLSAEELALAHGVSPSYVRAVERGDRAPAPDLAVGLLRQLGMSIDRKPANEDDRPDLVFSDGVRSYVVEFKHWPTRSARFAPGSRAVTRKSLGSGKSASAVDGDSALLGEVVRRLAGLRSEQLSRVASILDAAEAESLEPPPSSSAPSYGEPLGAVRSLGESNATLTVYRGELQVGKEPLMLRGSISLKWSPRPELVWQAQQAAELSGARSPDSPSEVVNVGPVHFALPGREGGHEVTGAYVTNVNSDGSVGGSLSRLVLGKSNVPAGSVEFDLANFWPPIGGSPLSSTPGNQAGTLELTAGPLKIVLESHPNSAQLQPNPNVLQGFALTHTGRLRKADQSAVTIEECSEVLDVLQLALSFAVGRWVAPVSVKGLGNDGRPVWSYFDSPRCEPWDPSRASWWNGLRLEDFRFYVSCFYAFAQDPQRRSALERCVQYALAARGSTSVSIDSGLLLAQAGLELLAGIRSAEGSAMSSASEAGTFADHLRMMLVDARLSTEIPESLPNLYRYGRRLSDVAAFDAAEALVKITNSLVHPNPRPVGEDTRETAGAVTDAWRLALHYLDLLLLHWIGYDRSFASRLAHISFRADTDLVPWSSQRVARAFAHK